MTPVLVARPGQTIAEAMAQPGADGFRQLPVVDGSGDRLRPIGLLRRTDILSAYLRASDRQATLARRLTAAASTDHNDLVGIEFGIRDKDPYDGHTLSELALPQEAIVTSIIRGGRPIVPRGAIKLRPGDQLHITTVAGARDKVLAKLNGNG